MAVDVGSFRGKWRAAGQIRVKWHTSLAWRKPQMEFQMACAVQLAQETASDGDNGHALAHSI
jgi:hypothetical protein